MAKKSMANDGGIQLRKVSVHNLKSVDLDIPYHQLTVLCGLSGSGKSSLAIDTLYAEGQRRYIESFSAYTRQFLEKLEKPEAERIDGIQPAIAVTSRPATQMSRSTVGTATETADYLRLLFSKIGRVLCGCCGRDVHCDSSESIMTRLATLRPGTKLMIAFAPQTASWRSQPEEFAAEWKEKGFLRGIMRGKTFRLDNGGFLLDDYAEARLLALADQHEPEPLEIAINSESVEPPGDDFSLETTPESLFDDMAEVGATENERDRQPSVLPDAVSADDPLEPLDDTDLETRPDEAANDTADEVTDEMSESADESQSRGDFDQKGGRILTIRLEGDASLADYVDKRNAALKPGGPPAVFFVVDRVVLKGTADDRIRESLEAALEYGAGQCWIFCEGGEFPAIDPVSIESASIDPARYDSACTDSAKVPPPRVGIPYPIDGADWTLLGYSRHLRCEDCGIEYPVLEPKLFSFNSPLGACPLCEGFGNLMILDLDLIIPNRNRSIADGAILPWNSPSYRHKFKELLGSAETLSLRTDVPVSELTATEMDRLVNGMAGSGWDGLNGFFKRLQKQKYKMHIRVFLSRWRSYRVCPLCSGARLRPEALAVKVGGVNIHQFSSMKISDALAHLRSWTLTDWERQVGATPLAQVENRLRYLEQVGLGYLACERPMRTLSEGEQRRVNLTSILGSSLTDMLYVLDEPTIGLHPQDTARLLESILALRNRRNTVVAVEHEEAILAAADRIVEIGPEAGQRGGRIVFEGTYEEIKADEKSLTGSYLSGRRSGGASANRRILEHGFLELTGATGNNLANVHAVFPLGLLCVVTGVSGAGKSSLVQETLYPALCRKLAKTNIPPGLPYENLLGAGQIDEVIMIDQSPIGRSPRSNPVTYLKIFDDIRSLFAQSPDAKAKGFGAGHFSFNVDGGRCNPCKGEGYLTIDLQFMADVFVKCPQCSGKRYQRDVLDILYRGMSIAEVLEFTVREAFAFFRGETRVQQKLKRLIDVGLGYLQLGQPANTLSGGESQRLKLAAYLSNARKGRCLFLMDEPTTGLHFADIVQLLDGFDALLQTGHSIILVEHNLQMMKAADYIIDLGPGAAEDGGRIVAEGTPEQIARNENSVTGSYLAHYLRG